MLAMTLIVFLTFMSAYLSPSKSTYVLVNNMGEADVEFILMTFLLLLNAATTLTLSKSIYVGRREADILRKIRFLKRNKAYVKELSQAQKRFATAYEN